MSLKSNCVFIFTAFLLTDSNSTEFDPETKHPVVGIVVVKQISISA